MVALPDEIRPERLSKALAERYLAYALSTITQRALPDARDGLKPVHRRILFGMQLLRLNPDSAFKKSAKVVGDVMGSFHPHGDQAIYDALVRLAQDFSVRYPLVDGQGNFGNVDGDNAAAMRYTESRMTDAAAALLQGLDEDAVDFRTTYDGETREPVVLPAAFPNLLANGASGIAVGMATNIPPHNLGELIAATIALIENPDLQDRSLLKHVKGPDFPTGGIVVEDPAAIAEAYKTGRGSFRLRARWEKEESQLKNGRGGAWQIVITEIPYQVQKSRLIERIAELMEQKKLPLLDDIHDESAEDIRIVLTPKSRTVDPEILMEQLFRSSDLEVRVPLNMNVLDKGLVPRVMSLRETLQAFIDHRREVLERRSRHRLEKIAARLEVLEGYLAVYLNLDKVIRIIRTEDEPKPVLMKAFKLTETQADAILNMRLRSLRKLEEMEIRGEHAGLTKEHKELTRMLGSEKLKSARLIAELGEIDAKFGLKTPIGRRRTEIAKAALVAEVTALAEHVEERANAVPQEPITVVCSAKGWLRALKGHQEQSKDDKYREGDKARFWLHAQTTDRIMLLATDGRFYTLDAARLPGGRGLGEAIRTFIDLPPEVDIVTMFVHVPGRKLLVAATSGHGFITSEDDAIAMTRKGKAVMNVKPGVEAASCHGVDGDHVAVIGRNHKLVIFPIAEVPEMARGQGVYLQRYSNSELADAIAFHWKAGLKDANGRTFTASELKDWKGARAQAGRLAPRGFAKTDRFADPQS
ncbi:MAG TPA: DNA topoisomerase IV subunit A [Rhizomicrobium sp.]|jgi:topoisomerase-4 subunit A|nr:DNA topoisomerase IV subunit A [Rhizomicrobium sp.]